MNIEAEPAGLQVLWRLVSVLIPILIPTWFSAYNVNTARRSSARMAV